nr:hypothetical protein CFP56_19653 [Quercus suber]
MEQPQMEYLIYTTACLKYRNGKGTNCIACLEVLVAAVYVMRHTFCAWRCRRHHTRRLHSQKAPYMASPIGHSLRLPRLLQSGKLHLRNQCLLAGSDLRTRCERLALISHGEENCCRYGPTLEVLCLLTITGPQSLSSASAHTSPPCDDP